MPQRTQLNPLPTRLLPGAGLVCALVLTGCIATHNLDEALAPAGHPVALQAVPPAGAATAATPRSIRSSDSPRRHEEVVAATFSGPDSPPEQDAILPRTADPESGVVVIPGERSGEAPWAPHIGNLGDERRCCGPAESRLCARPDQSIEADLAVVFPRLSSVFRAPVTLGDDVETVPLILPNAELAPTVSPALQLGFYRFGPGFGELAFNYRILASDGTELAADASRIHSRLNLQTFGVDYLGSDVSLGDGMCLKWGVGGRLQAVFFDTRSESVDLSQHARNYAFGAGPRAGATAICPLASGVGLFGGVDAAWIMGYVTQKFAVVKNDPVNGILRGDESQQSTMQGPSFAVQTGVRWTPEWWPCSRLEGGYRFEQWYRIGDAGNSSGDLAAHGIFCNWELTF